jgi:hypothetical protein
MYEVKVRESIYGVTGRNDTEEAVVERVERILLDYLSKVKHEMELRHSLRLERKEGRTKQLHIDDLYAALSGTPELYGAKRCMILKQLARTAENDDESGSLDSYHQQLDNLNDGSESYRIFERLRLEDLVYADELTRDMSCDDYLEYSKKGKTAFIGRAKLFCEWLNWNPAPPAKILTAFGWLATYRVKRLIRDALARNSTSLDPYRLSIANFS